MTEFDKLLNQLLDDKTLLGGIEEMALVAFRPIREDRSYGFDLGSRTTTFRLPDSMPQRVEALVKDITYEIARRVVPILHKQATDEAKHNLIRRLDQVLS
ncbi:hypothetical protein ADL19_14740 [Streptomyces purpurogeneiscleroticus]|nr:hypothetical protein ADL19_14740 [Streptomyces purpurogeneiscleroticus]